MPRKKDRENVVYYHPEKSRVQGVCEVTSTFSRMTPREQRKCARIAFFNEQIAP
ncbi:hypothetical protein Loa_02766 [Legionella oakridgensis ATCC 33761 = DSM 21215]|uniref:Uncharacterized protein n=2 Tax=Legionella oakridgensis TaxID=29423 RepID=W0BHZ3_9GAMM|nr:hypothetical protein Loa_02766 [Legionella oakridgensis ATCC 33761 = DSM 21215]ETO92217.1 hypothetical protein LOR_89c24870 [Legionella oakridgensis RV-2-2007]KTD39026.1 hypothetical protein Loak_1147 [Legionella oakridgensis]STY21246.1 Uncharacterised protein [Legionella longbeachae]